jgi:phenylacetate-CoA ligase
MELQNYQDEKLHELVHHVFNHVPYYSKWFKLHNLKPDDIKTRADLNKLPIVTKHELRKNPELFRAQIVNTKKQMRMCSSGSTGEPFEYYISRNAYSMRYAAALRGWTWMGYRLGDHYAKLSQNDRTSKIKKLQDMVNHCSYIFIPDLSRYSLNKILKTIENTKPLFIRCYPDPLFFMAKILKENNKILKGIRAINSTGNILTNEAKEYIEERFGCPVYDSYSCEGSALFYEGPYRDNYLGSMEYAITEVLDTGLNEIKAGEPGMHITTDLHNYAMPMIRYNTQDLVEQSTVQSSCGRKLFGLRIIIGRDNDILITPTGSLLIVHIFTIYFEYFESIKRFQIEQTQADEFIFRLVVNESFNMEIQNQIFSYWQEKLGKKVKLTIEILDDISFQRSGKRRFLIRNPEIDLIL